MDKRQVLYQSAAEIEDIVRRFEACTFGSGEFRHREHLMVILWYLSKFSVPEATRRMREGLYKFLEHHGHGRHRYHETITLFWVKKVNSLLESKRKPRSLAGIANEVIEVCGEANFIFAYYSQQLIDSAAAREGWTEPDLRRLDF